MAPVITHLAASLDPLRRPARAARGRVPAATCEGWEVLVKLTVNDADAELDGHHAKPPLPLHGGMCWDRADGIRGWTWIVPRSPS